jgi:hypothetical protein
LGFGGETPQVTRLWARYTPEAASQDLMLYQDGEFSPVFQLRYISYDQDLESTFLVCGEEDFPRGAGTCDEEDDASEASVPPTAGLAGTLGAVLLAGALLRRRS